MSDRFQKYLDMKCARFQTTSIPAMSDNEDENKNKEEMLEEMREENQEEIFEKVYSEGKMIKVIK